MLLQVLCGFDTDFVGQLLRAGSSCDDLHLLDCK